MEDSVKYPLRSTVTLETGQTIEEISCLLTKCYLEDLGKAILILKGSSYASPLTPESSVRVHLYPSVSLFSTTVDIKNYSISTTNK